MKTSLGAMQNLVDTAPKAEQIQLVERASFCLGRLRAKLEDAPVAVAFANRQRLREAVLSARLEDRLTDEFRLLAASAELPLRAQRDRSEGQTYELQSLM